MILQWSQLEDTSCYTGELHNVELQMIPQYIATAAAPGCALIARPHRLAYSCWRRQRLRQYKMLTESEMDALCFDLWKTHFNDLADTGNQCSGRVDPSQESILATQSIWLESRTGWRIDLAGRLIVDLADPRATGGSCTGDGVCRRGQTTVHKQGEEAHPQPTLAPKPILLHLPASPCPHRSFQSRTSSGPRATLSSSRVTASSL